MKKIEGGHVLMAVSILLAMTVFAIVFDHATVDQASRALAGGVSVGILSFGLAHFV